LIDTLSLQEARASSEIENIITTQEEMFHAAIFPEGTDYGAAKEVARYRDALRRGWDLMSEQQWLLSNNTIIEIFQVLKRTVGGFRETPGTALKNDITGEVVYVPPQDRNEIIARMTQLERFLNEDTVGDLDPLVKMAIAHHQFESIHPFPDGNGRVGRIINVLYLARVELLHVPILYLSRFITAHKADYYRLLQLVRDEGAWEEWILYMLRAVEETSAETLRLIDGIGRLMAQYKDRIRTQHPKIYSQDLLNNLFRHPYTRIDYLAKETGKVRQTASKYLEELAEAGVLKKRTSGKHVFFVNEPLVALFVSSNNEKGSYP